MKEKNDQVPEVQLPRQANENETSTMPILKYALMWMAGPITYDRFCYA